jgi:hypothetical protein
MAKLSPVIILAAKRASILEVPIEPLLSLIPLAHEKGKKTVNVNRASGI